jgi:DNA invertase Pin-like site-specific DNA recombinase
MSESEKFKELLLAEMAKQYGKAHSEAVKRGIAAAKARKLALKTEGR